ncbi:MAG TPA: hypothetical protein VFZ53_31730 [Polyangiaceae bacterium]
MSVRNAMIPLVFRVVAPLALLSSCALAEEPLDEVVGDQAQPYNLGSSPWLWKTGDSGQFMGYATSDYFCTLVSIRGPFYGAGEEVRINRAPAIGEPGKYKWFLSGDSQQPGVMAFAACIRSVLGYTGETLWSQGEPAKDLGPTNDRVCFLSRIRGHFMGDGEQVRIRKSVGRWLLDGTSQQSGVRAGARCVYSSPDFMSASEHYVHNGGSGAASLQIGGNGDGNGDDDFCGITRVKGQLDVQSEFGVWPSNGPWFVKIRSDTPGPLGVGARCLFHEFIVP